MNQQLLFADEPKPKPLTADHARESERRKREGMMSAAESRRENLDKARRLAEWMVLRGGWSDLTADDVAIEWERRGYGHWNECIGNAAGSLFRGEEWRWTFGRREATRKQSHANELKVWEYRG